MPYPEDIRELERAMMLIEIRRAGMSPLLADELDHYMSGVDRDPEDWPDGYTEADALEAVTDLIDFYDGQLDPGLRKVRTEMRDAEVALGLVVPGSYLDATCLQWIARAVYRHKNVTYYWRGSEA